jgi:SAM-dependent methyltransferase
VLPEQIRKSEVQVTDLYNDSLHAYEEMAENYALKDGVEMVDERLLNFFLERLPSNPVRILDLGSGPGHYARRFATLGHEVLAADNSPEMLEELDRRGRPAGVIPLLIDMRRLDLSANSVDAVWASAVLIHLVAEDLPGTLRRLHDSLKPGGVMMANFAVSNLGLRHERTGEDEYAAGGRFFQHYDDPGEPLSQLRDAGFAIVDSYENVVRPLIGDGTVRGLIRWLNVLAVARKP